MPKLKEILKHLCNCQCMICTDPSIVIPKESAIDTAISEIKSLIKEKLPKKIKPEHCEKHRKVLAWTCPRCASFFSHNQALTEIERRVEEM